MHLMQQNGRLCLHFYYERAIYVQDLRVVPLEGSRDSSEVVDVILERVEILIVHHLLDCVLAG